MFSEFVRIHGIVSPSMLIVCGLTLAIGLRQLFWGIYRREEAVHFLLTGMCAIVFAYEISSIVLYTTDSLPIYITMSKATQALLTLFFVLFIPYIIERGLLRSGIFAYALMLFFGVACVASLMLPGGIAYREITGLRQITMPWGEIITRPVAENLSNAFSIGVLVVLTTAYIGCVRLIKQGKKTSGWLHFAGLTLFTLSVLNDIFVVSDLYNFMFLGEFGFCALLTVMSIDLAREIIQVSTLREDLVESENRYRLLAENVGDFVWVTDLNSRPIYVSPAVEKQRGYTVEEAMNQTFEQTISEDTLPPVREAFASDMASLEKGELPPESTRVLEYKTICKDGTTLWVESVMTLQWESGKPTAILGVTRDISERKEAEEEHNRMESEMRKLQKLESLGVLAGGIAHDFNNILSAQMGYSVLAKEFIPKDSEAQEYLDEVIKASERSKRLVQQILSFSRQSESLHVPCKVQAVVDDAMKLLRKTVPANIDIQTEIDNTCSPILADEQRMHQIVMNLVTNAYHAVPSKTGIITIRVCETTLARDSIDVPAGQYVLLTVADNGEGMSEEIASKIFDPYFTTKDVGKGTGLGLSMVHGIVKEHNGFITVESEPDQGSLFSVYLPVTEEESSRPQKADNPPARTVQRETEGHILIVDDEPSLVKLNKTFLESLGYKVDAYTSSNAAQKAFLAAPNKYRVLITDQAMPEMTGIELARELLQISPNLIVIMCTGYSAAIDEDEAMAQGIRAFLMKPVDPEQLARTVDNALSKPSNNSPSQKQ